MNWLSWLVIIGIIGFVILKNWDKISPMFRRVEKKSNEEFTMELSKKEIEKVRQEKLQYLQNEKNKRYIEMSERTADLKKEIKEIEMEIFMLENSNEKFKRF